jgi:uncharacterized protein YegL
MKSDLEVCNRFIPIFKFRPAIIGRTPTGAKLQQNLRVIMKTLDDAVDTPAYFKIKPVDVIVLTDGVPSKTQSIVSPRLL